MTETDVRTAIAAQRRELATVLSGLSAESWDAPTLCEGWRVRELVAHITMPYRYSVPRFMGEMLKAGGSFNRMADRRARADAAAISAADLVATLRDNADHAWKPPGGGLEGALSHDVVHGLDFTVPLALDHDVPLERISLVLGSLRTRNVRFFGVDLNDVELRADDLDWTYGSGSPLTGSAQHLLLVLCGRKLPPGLLHGPQRDRFSRS